jgi:GT2 family glycosyltransferase
LNKILVRLNAAPFVAIVILNWNGRRFLQQFLPSVIASTYPNYKVIVADNASTDDSVTFLKAHYPAIEIITLPQNFGFAKGYNEALKKVTADYYMLLNSDVEVTADWLQPMVALLERNQAHAACQPKILAYNEKNLFEYAGGAGGWLDTFGYPFARGRVFDVCETDRRQYNNTQEVFWASGAAMLIKPAVFHGVLGFDEAFFAHQEEIDFCWRLQLQGYKIFCCPEAVVYHVGGGTLPRGNSRKTFLNFRNNLIMLAKNGHRSETWWKIPFRLSLDQVSALKGLFSGDAGYFIAILKAHLAFYKWLLLDRAPASANRKKMKALWGVYPHSIVWQHFVKKKNLFSQIVKKDNEI